MKIFMYVISLFIILGCSNGQRENLIMENQRLVQKDTIIIYDIESISTEGAEAKVSYVNGKITKSITSIYASTWQMSIEYDFQKDKIKVLESKYSYKTEIENVRSNEDMNLDYEISYFIDFEGKIIGKSVSDRIDIFEEFKAIVPFELE
jgi:hypothetical protein